MKKNFTLFFLLFMLFISTKAQIQNVIVEKYYISDTLDAKDSINYYDDATYLMPILPVGSVTYRVYIQLDHGFKIKKIYGTPCNPLKIMSTSDFYNNIDRPGAYLPYMVNKSWFSGNHNLMLDSWLTLGLCTKLHKGVLKTEDYDGSVVLPGWNALKNNDPLAGIPIDTADGMVPKSGVFTTWIDNGIRDISGVDTTAFGSVNVGTQFISTSAYLQQNSGVTGDSILNNNKVLIAQLTTTGTISFELNLELLDSIGNSYNFVSHNCGASVTGDTVVSGLLKYPPVCGCKDPNFLEYNASFSCFDSSKCLTRIVYGCTDTLACNYDPHANFNIQYLCCYPGNCANRDISLVCPSISGGGGLQVYPNPASEQITLQFSAGNNNETKYSIYDSYGTIVLDKDLGTRSGSIVEQIEISDFHPGIYFVRLFIGSTMESTTFMKQ